MTPDASDRRGEDDTERKVFEFLKATGQIALTQAERELLIDLHRDYPPLQSPSQTRQDMQFALRLIDRLLVELTRARSASQRGEPGYQGEIKVGMKFLWEPFIPHATEHCIVTRITGPGEDEKIAVPGSTCILSGGHERRIWTRSWVSSKPVTNGGDYTAREVYNDEGRFREAVIVVPASPDAAEKQGEHRGQG